MLRERMTRQPNQHKETSRNGNNWRAEYCTVSCLVWATTIELCSGCENAKGCVGESKEDLRREHHNQEAPTPIGVEQPTTTRFVGGKLHIKDKGHL